MFYFPVTATGIVQDHLRITAIRIIVGIPITEMTIETIVVVIVNIVEAEITEMVIAEITITTVGTVGEAAGEDVAEAAAVEIITTEAAVAAITTEEENGEIIMPMISTETAKKINFPIIWNIFHQKMTRLPPELCSRAIWN